MLNYDVGVLKKICLQRLFRELQPTLNNNHRTLEHKQKKCIFVFVSVSPKITQALRFLYRVRVVIDRVYQYNLKVKSHLSSCSCHSKTTTVFTKVDLLDAKPWIIAVGVKAANLDSKNVNRIIRHWYDSWRLNTVCLLYLICFL